MGHVGGVPIFAWLMFLAALLWLLNDYKVLVMDAPWLAIFAFLFSLKVLAKSYCCR